MEKFRKFVRVLEESRTFYIFMQSVAWTGIVSCTVAIIVHFLTQD